MAPTESRHESFVFGATYYPRSSGPYWWERFRRDEVEADFETVARLGLPLVRVELTWEVFQPDRDRVSAAALRDLESVLDLALDSGLRVMLCVLAPVRGELLWLPPWALAVEGPDVRRVLSAHSVSSRAVRDPFTDSVMVAAEELLVREVIGNLHEHPAIDRWQLADSITDIAPGPSPDAACRWLAQLVSIAREYDRAHPVLCGLSTSDLRQDHGLRPHELAESVDGFTLSVTLLTDDPLAPWRTAALLSRIADKPIIVQGVRICSCDPREGALNGCLSLAAGADAVEEALTALVERGGSGGAIAGPLYDLPPEPWVTTITGNDPSSQYTGLFAASGTQKPVADVWSRVARSQPHARSLAHAAPSLDPEQYWRELPDSYEVWNERLRHEQT